MTFGGGIQPSGQSRMAMGPSLVISRLRTESGAYYEEVVCKAKVSIVLINRLRVELEAVDLSRDWVREEGCELDELTSRIVVLSRAMRVEVRKIVSAIKKTKLVCCKQKLSVERK